jgi:hypothetical protein
MRGDWSHVGHISELGTEPWWFIMEAVRIHKQDSKKCQRSSSDSNFLSQRKIGTDVSLIMGY